MRILHLSDLHFGIIPTGSVGHTPPKNAGESSHAFVKNGKPSPSRLAGILKKDLGQAIPDAVVASGDIGWSFNSDDYQWALDFFKDLRKAWPGKPLLVVPGNHDVDLLNESISNNARQQAYTGFVQLLYPTGRSKRYPFLATNKLPERQRLVSFELVDDQFLIVGVNSSAAINHDKNDRPVFVQPDVLDRIAEHLSKLAVTTNSSLDNKRAQEVGGTSGFVRSVSSSECVENRGTGDAYSLPAGALRRPGPASG